MPRPHRVTVREQDLSTAAQLHALLAKELGFPNYYGSNLDALEDCLLDIHEPTRIVIWRDEQESEPWFDGFVEVIRECAQRSCYLGCTIR